tara:strand:+ start:193 stop:837 length:645 start_codon:yes stop_codon:yes gene_type:complete
MPESNKIISSYLQILKKRGIKSFLNELVDNHFFDLFNNVETQIRVGKSNNSYHYYAPIYNSVIKESFSSISDHKKLIFIDVGCGKGKAVLLALDFNFKKIIGVEINKNLSKICNENIKNYKFSKNKKNISIINKNALDYKVTDENVFFFFDPFSENILNIFLKKIISSIKKRKRVIYIIYANPPKKNLILKNNFKILKIIKRNTYNCNVYKLKF